MSLGSRGYVGSLDRAGTRCRVSNENILMSASSDRCKALSPIEASHSRKKYLSGSDMAAIRAGSRASCCCFGNLEGTDMRWALRRVHVISDRKE